MFLSNNKRFKTFCAAAGWRLLWCTGIIKQNATSLSDRPAPTSTSYCVKSSQTVHTLPQKHRCAYYTSTITKKEKKRTTRDSERHAFCTGHTRQGSLAKHKKHLTLVQNLNTLVDFADKNSLLACFGQKSATSSHTRPNITAAGVWRPKYGCCSWTQKKTKNKIWTKKEQPTDFQKNSFVLTQFSKHFFLTFFLNILCFFLHTIQLLLHFPFFFFHRFFFSCI